MHWFKYILIWPEVLHEWLARPFGRNTISSLFPNTNPHKMLFPSSSRERKDGRGRHFIRWKRLSASDLHARQLAHWTVHCIPSNERSLALQSCLVLSQRWYVSLPLFLCFRDKAPIKRPRRRIGHVSFCATDSLFSVPADMFTYVNYWRFALWYSIPILKRSRKKCCSLALAKSQFATECFILQIQECFCKIQTDQGHHKNWCLSAISISG